MREPFQLQINQSENGYLFSICDQSGELILESHSFNVASEYTSALSLAKKHGIYDENYLRMVTPEGQFYLLIRDDVGSLIATGTTVNSISERNQIINQCVRFIKSSKFKLNPIICLGLFLCLVH